MAVEIFYDKYGQPKSVLLSYAEYLELIKETIIPEKNKTADVSIRGEVNEDLIDKRYYNGATGYYTESGGFCIIKGSFASGSHAYTFSHDELFSELKKEKILVQEDKQLMDLTFTKDYHFNSPSAAASIVSGCSRSGPEAWGKK